MGCRIAFHHPSLWQDRRGPGASVAGPTRGPFGRHHARRSPDPHMASRARAQRAAGLVGTAGRGVALSLPRSAGSVSWAGRAGVRFDRPLERTARVHAGWPARVRPGERGWR